MDIKKYFDTLSVKFICGGFAKSTEEICSIENKTSFARLYYLTSGNVNFTINDEKIKAHPNSIVIIPAGCSCTVTGGRGGAGEAYWIYFDASSCGGDLFKLVKCEYIVDVDNDEIVTRIFENILYNPENYSEITKIFSDKSELLKLISYFFSKTNCELCKDNIALKDAVEFMENNIDSKLGVESIAATMKLTKNHCSNMFVSSFGTPTVKFLSDLRILKARELLETTDMKIGDIGKISGCGEIQVFSKMFKNGVGFSPKKYRHMFGKTIKIEE